MNIIKSGDTRIGFEGEWRCSQCGCVWEMTKADAPPARYSDQRDGSGFHMPCPTCHREVYRDTPQERR